MEDDCEPWRFGYRSPTTGVNGSFENPAGVVGGSFGNWFDGHLYPENQQPLVITAAPYAPGWIPSDFPEDIPITMEEQVQKAVDCYEAGATVLHLHVREMIIQVGGSISFAPEGPGGEAQWLSDDTRHMLAELDPRPDQVTAELCHIHFEYWRLIVFFI